MDDVTAKKTSPYFVYVNGSGSTLYTSTNGTEFDPVTVGSNMGMGFSSQSGKVFRKTNGDIFAYPDSINSQVLKSSDNGASWTSVPWSVEENEYLFPWYYYYAHANSGDTLVSMNHSKLYYSTNGLDFIKGTFPFSNPSGSTWDGQSSIVWDGNRFIASFIPSPTDLPTDKVFISTSINGISWGTPVELNLSGAIDISNGISGQTAKLYSVGSRYFIVIAGKTAYSDNLTSWTAINTPETNPNFNDSSYDFIVGEKAFIQYSKNYSTNIVTVTIYSPELGYDELTQISSLPSNLSTYFPSDFIPFYVSEGFNGFYVRDYNNNYASAYKLNSDGSWTETLTPFSDERISFYEDIDITNVRFDGVIENGSIEDTTVFEVPGIAYLHYPQNMMGMEATEASKVSYDLNELYSFTPVSPKGSVNGILFAAKSVYDSGLNRSVTTIYSSDSGQGFDEIYQIDADYDLQAYMVTDVVYFDGAYVFSAINNQGLFSLFYSEDLASWSEIDLTNTVQDSFGYAPSLVTNGEILLATGTSGRYVVSLESLSSTPEISYDNGSGYENITSISFDSGSNQFFVANNSSPDQEYVLKSSDGISWSVLAELNKTIYYQGTMGQNSAGASSIRSINTFGDRSLVDYGSMGGGQLVFDGNFTNPRSFISYLREIYDPNLASYGLSNVSIINGILFGTLSRYVMDPGYSGYEIKFLKTDLGSYVDIDQVAGTSLVKAFRVNKTRQKLGAYVSGYVALETPLIVNGIIESTLSNVSITGGEISNVDISNSIIGEGVKVGYPVDGSVSFIYDAQTNRQKLTAKSVVDGKSTVLATMPEGFSSMNTGGIRTVNGKPVYSGSIGPGSSTTYYGTEPLTLPSVNNMTYFDNLYYANGKYFITMRQCGTTCVYSLFVSDDLSTWTELSGVFIDQSGDRYISSAIRDIVYIHGEYSILYNSYDQVTSITKIHESYSSNLTSWSQEEITAPNEDFTSLNFESFNASPNNMHAVGAVLMYNVDGSNYVGILNRPSDNSRWQLTDSGINFSSDASMDNSARVAVSNNNTIVIAGRSSALSLDVFKYSTDNGATWVDIDTQSIGLDLSQSSGWRLYSDTKKLVLRVTLDAGATTEFYSSNDGKTWEYYATSSSYGGSLSWVSLPMSITDAFLNAEWGV
jgi:hypothetical protein